jgi:exodeoxyribonuclease V alpha subunit
MSPTADARTTDPLDPLGDAELFSPVPPSAAVLEPYVAAGVFGPTEVHLADLLVRLAARDDRRAGRAPQPVDDLVLLAAAVAARAPRSGHVGVELDDVHRVVVDRRTEPGADLLEWPDVERWAAALSASPMVALGDDAAAAPLRPLVWDGERLYLHRLWVDEVAVARALRARAAAASSVVAGATAALADVFGTDPAVDRQHQAARRALDGRLAVVVGGPGTGKTRTIARMLAAALVAEPQLQLALCAPTGKAAARMTDAVKGAVAELGDESRVPAEVLARLNDAQATTVHRLLGRRPGGAVRHDRATPLPHDLVVVDETSMVDLPLMARLLDALRPEARLVLVGDPDQLASVEAGTVLADLVGRSSGDTGGDTSSVLRDRVVELTVAHRFREGSGIAELAAAIRDGDAGAVLSLLGQSRDDLSWVRPDDAEALGALRDRVVGAAVGVARAAREGQAADALRAARQLKVLCATRLGSFGLYEWSDLIEAQVGEQVPELRTNGRWEAGRPFLVTRNDPVARVANGDTGVVVDLHGRRVLAVDTGATTPMPVPVARLDQVEPWWAMTIHKSQGSEFDQVVVSLPTVESPVLTRELLYTAVTRAKGSVTVLADAETVRRAVQRPVSRASGLRDRLR